MEESILRAIKSIFFSAIAFVSLLYLGFSTASAAVIAALPLFLGITNVMAGAGFALSVASMIAAVAWFIMGPDQRDMVRSTFASVAAEISEKGSGSSESTATQPATPSTEEAGATP